MAKKKKLPIRRRNAAPLQPRVPRPPRTPRASSDGETPLHRLGYTAAGAAGTALVGSFLAREGWAPKTVASALGAVGAGLAWKGDSSTIRSVGAGAMSAAGSQLALMMIDDRGKPSAPAPSSVMPIKKLANAVEALPPGALERAFERAKAHLEIAAQTAHHE